MNPRHQTIQKAGILAAAFLLFWIYLGSLINFHQHHLMGRTLISLAIVNKREKTNLVSHEKTLPFFLAWASLTQSEEGAKVHSFLFSVNRAEIPVYLHQHEFYHATGLRAPPLSA